MLTITHFSLTHVGLISLVLVPGLCAAPAHAQCPDNIPASLVSSIQDPDLRAAAMKSPPGGSCLRRAERRARDDDRSASRSD